KAAGAAESAARRTGEPYMLARVRPRTAELAAIQVDYQAVRDKVAQLAANPSDPAANVAAGRFYCFTRGLWARGLPLLAKGPDPALKAVAVKDLAAPEAADAQLALADAWTTAARAAPIPAADRIRLRAAF